MKCRLIEEKEIHEPSATPELMKQCVRRDGHVFAPVGTLLEGPDCWRIVMMAQAEPADDECRDICNLTPEKWALMLQARKRLKAGIAPEDFAKFDAGEITGYDADGKYVPGPNAKPDLNSVDEEDDE